LASRDRLALRPRGQFLAVTLVPSLRAESRFAGWIAPLWILALIGLLFLPTEYRGGASMPHSHALLQLLLDAQDGHFLHTHAHPAASAGFAYDWLEPVVTEKSAGAPQAHSELGGQQQSAPTLSIISFLVMLPLLSLMRNALPRVVPEARRLFGRMPRVLSPPPRVAVIPA
jgi:hypothetical protein